MKKKSVAVIGCGISGLSAAAYAAKNGYHVEIFEKNAIPGGRARQYKTDNGYVFDMGPSWYWMPDIFENFFKDFNLDIKDYLELIPLNPQFEMIFKSETIKIPSNYTDLKNLCESLEPGSGEKLDKFMESAAYKYKIGMQEFVNKPCNTWLEFASPKVIKSAFKLDLLTNFRKYVRKYFSHPYLCALMEFPVIFLGASPKDIPALYSLMNYGGYALGTFYPKNGFFQLIKSMVNIVENLGVKIHYNSPIQEIIVENNKATEIIVNDNKIKFDYIIGSSDYHHTETLLPKSYRNYTEEYWQKKTFAPSCLIYYIGINEKIINLEHHTLFFENDLDTHIDEIYVTKKWPTEPLFYVCCPSKSDDTVAPPNKENLFLLMPLPINIDDDEVVREKYFDEMISRIETKTGTKNLKDKIEYKKSYCISDFKNDYNAYGGNAYGLANTLNQTAVFKPSIHNKKIKNLLYTGQLTVPGPGVPPALISGKIVAEELLKLK